MPKFVHDNNAGSIFFSRPGVCMVAVIVSVKGGKTVNINKALIT